MLKWTVVTGLFCLLSCAGQEPVPTVPGRLPDDTFIALQRGNCEGGCPVYRIMIFANGDVIWQGRGRVARTGVLQSQIEGARIRALVDQFNAVGFFELEDIYGYQGTGCESTEPDMPMVILTFAMGGRARILSHHDGCVGGVSGNLAALEDAIDRAVNSAQWITGEPAADR